MDLWRFVFVWKKKLNGYDGVRYQDDNVSYIGYQDDIEGDNLEDNSRWYPDDNVSYDLLL